MQHGIGHDELEKKKIYIYNSDDAHICSEHMNDNIIYDECAFYLKKCSVCVNLHVYVQMKFIVYLHNK